MVGVVLVDTKRLLKGKVRQGNSQTHISVDSHHGTGLPSPQRPATKQQGKGGSKIAVVGQGCSSDAVTHPTPKPPHPPKGAKAKPTLAQQHTAQLQQRHDADLFLPAADWATPRGSAPQRQQQQQALFSSRHYTPLSTPQTAEISSSTKHDSRELQSSARNPLPQPPHEVQPATTSGAASFPLVVAGRHNAHHHRVTGEEDLSRRTCSPLWRRRPPEPSALLYGDAEHQQQERRHEEEEGKDEEAAATVVEWTPEMQRDFQRAIHRHYNLGGRRSQGEDDADSAAHLSFDEQLRRAGVSRGATKKNGDEEFPPPPKQHLPDEEDAEEDTHENVNEEEDKKTHASRLQSSKTKKNGNKGDRKWTDFFALELRDLLKKKKAMSAAASLAGVASSPSRSAGSSGLLSGRKRYNNRATTRIVLDVQLRDAMAELRGKSASGHSSRREESKAASGVTSPRKTKDSAESELALAPPPRISLLQQQQDQASNMMAEFRARQLGLACVRREGDVEVDAQHRREGNEEATPHHLAAPAAPATTQFLRYRRQYRAHAVCAATLKQSALRRAAFGPRDGSNLISNGCSVASIRDRIILPSFDYVHPARNMTAPVTSKNPIAAALMAQQRQKEQQIEQQQQQQQEQKLQIQERANDEGL